MIAVEVALGDRTYPVLVGPGVRQELAGVLSAGVTRVAVVTQAGIGLGVEPGREHRTFEIPGQLELLGRPQALTLTATWNKSGPSPIDKVYTMGVSARGTFKRSSYGMNYGDEVPLIIEFEAQRK